VLSQDQTESEERLSSAVAAERADVMGRVAHQFGHIVRNSLTHLSTVAQLLPQRSADQEFLEEVCARTPTELHRVLHSVDQLEWMKRTIGPAVPINHIADRAEAIWQRLQTALGFATWPNLQVIVPHVTIWCEEASLEVVLYELLANAAHARPREGGVILTADEPGPNTVTFHIHDDGPGFTADALVRGIEPFYTTGNHGVGLGLTIVDRVVRAHGGKLRFSSSRRARGADVAFTLPLQPS
jgi:signal transduction histidine kinase